MKAKVVQVEMSQKETDCPVCGEVAKRHSNGIRKLKDLDDKTPVVLIVTYSKHYCKKCEKYFSISMGDLATESSRYTKRVQEMALTLMKEGNTLKETCLAMEKLHVKVPSTTIHDWLTKE